MYFIKVKTTHTWTTFVYGFRGRVVKALSLESKDLESDLPCGLWLRKQLITVDLIPSGSFVSGSQGRQEPY